MLRKNGITAIACVLLFACASIPVAEGASPNSSVEKIKILYTGQLLGYFRAPDGQSRSVMVRKDGTIDECSDVPVDKWSLAARAFQELREPAAILLGTGDNFAPRYEGRTFKREAGNDKGRGKDLYIWYPSGIKPDKGAASPNTWVYFEDAAKMTNFQEFLENGKGEIPADNVGCFLKRERYTAVVPGKHDFYFGAERLRELARFLDSNVGGHSVKMLGANLVIETSWKSDHKPLPETEHNWKYAPHWPTGFRDPEGRRIPALLSPGDNGKVYPWLPGAILKLADLKTTSLLYQEIFKKTNGSLVSGSAFEDILNKVTVTNDADKKSVAELSAAIDAMKDDKGKVYLCPTADRDPDDIVLPGNSGCPKIALDQFAWLADGAVEYILMFPQGLQAGKNYGLCMDGRYLPADKGGRDISFYCQRFSVFQPLFYALPQENNPEWPAPYAIAPADRDRGRVAEAAIFGVIDPSVAEYTGALNLQWENAMRTRTNSPYKTTVVIQEAAEAVKEAMLAFDWDYQGKNGKRFEGLRILLAQMSPQKAEILGRRLKNLDVVVTAADAELATGLHASRTEWTPIESAFPRDYPKIQAIPEPYSVATRSPRDLIVQIGELDLSVPQSFKDTWVVNSGMAGPKPADEGESKAEKFWAAVASTVQENCGVAPQHGMEVIKEKQKDGIQALTLCAIQKKAGGDVTLLQKRDFYIDFPESAEDLGQTTDALQALLDRVIWKGDFLTVLYVPGSALAKAMDQSKKYKADDASAVSLSDDQGRELLTLGMRYDSDRGEYLINGTPLEKDRLYAVATSDYIGVGDTGYPDLAAAAVKAPQVPEDFAKELETISAVACHLITEKVKGSECQSALNRGEYIDALAIKPVDPRTGQVWWKQLYQWSLLDLPHKVPGAKKEETIITDAEKAVQQRGLGALRINVPSPSLLSVDNASVSLTSVDHKFTDGKVATLFPGSPVPQLTTTRGHTLQVDVKPKYSYSWEHVEFFQAQEVRYNVQYTGKANASRVVNQKDNLWSTDTGLAGHLGGRALPHWEPVFTFHTETQVWNPLPNFLEGLATSGKPNVAQPFDQGRTYLLLPRLGMRFMDRVSWFEAGLEKGGELSVVRLVTNPSNPSQTLVQRPNISVSGIYWNWHAVIPFSSAVSWQIDEDGDYRFNTSGDNPIDTRFRSDAETALNFKIWPSLSFAPTYEIFLYSNKVQGLWFWQGQASIKMKTRFDFWNHRKWWTDQIRYSSAK